MVVDLYKWAVDNFINFIAVTVILAGAIGYIGETWRNKK